MSKITKADKTEDAYSFLWDREKKAAPVYWHFNMMQDVIPEPIVRGCIGIEIGSGCGYDTYIMAKNNPFVNLVSIDISDGIYKTKELVFGLGNVHLIKCSALDIPLKDGMFDFAYSFGVLHHTVSPGKGLAEMSRVLKKNSPAFLYLYEDHSGDIIKYIALKAVSLLRCITVRFPHRLVYLLSWLFSPFVFVIFSLPAKILNRFKSTHYFASRVPFNFATSPFSLAGDLYDRFSAPIEHRFGRKQIYDMFMASGFSMVRITKINGIAGWVVWGYKIDA